MKDRILTYEEVMSGLSNSVLRLFSFCEKKDLEKYCKAETLKSKDLFSVILGCESSSLPWRHQISHRDFVPEHLLPTQADREQMAHEDLSVGQKIPKHLRRLAAIFGERRYLVGHIFYSDNHSNWHLLYFDQRDIAPRNNHWQAGSHVHIVNSLTTRSTAKEVWRDFNSGKPKMKGIHIRWDDQRKPFRPGQADSYWEEKRRARK